MSPSQVAALAILVGTMTAFLWGRWRHDLVAMAALLTCVLAGLVPGERAFDGFAHPAVVTVVSVLVLSAGLQVTGAIDWLAKRCLPASPGTTTTVLRLVVLAAILSGFMNNIGALALLLPIAIQRADRLGVAPGKLLMPLAFGSILGGMTTLIGTPPNLIVSGFREETFGSPFRLFDFAPVGGSVAAAGVLFVGLVGWRWVPARRRSAAGSFETGAYLSEARVPAESPVVGRSLSEADRLLDEFGAQIVGLVRAGVRLSAPAASRRVRPGDILIVEIEPASLASALSSLGLTLEEDVPAPPPSSRERSGEREGPPPGDGEEESAAPESSTVESGDVTLHEVVVAKGAEIVGRTATGLELRSRYGINLLALSRQGRPTYERLRSISIQAGDLLLLQGTAEAVAGFTAQFGCLPLASREVRLPHPGRALAGVALMGSAVIATAFGLLPAAISFAAAAFALVALGILPLRSVYTAIDWPVVVLLAAMLPVAESLATTGAADAIARLLLDLVARGSAVAALTLLLVVTMFLSDLMNNAATAAVMCPIAVSTATHLGVSQDAFLMAVAIGASCAFLTPIGHQNNVLILGPGGFRFGDYWRLGLALEAIVVAIAVPILLRVWPL